MNLEIRGERLSPIIVDRIDRRLRFVLTRFGPHVRKVQVKFGVGARRGSDRNIVCRIAVHLRPSGRIFIEDTASDVQTAIDRAIDRAQHAVARAIEHARAFAGHRIVTQEVA